MPRGYVRRVLQPNERIVYTTRLHWRIWARCVILLLVSIAFAVAARHFPDRRPEIALASWIVAGMFLLLALSAGLRAFLQRVTTELAITDRRVIYKTGLMRRHTLEMSLDKIDMVEVDQTILGRILGYGTIIVRGGGGSLESLRNVARPLAFRSHITMAR
jgi:uncharacterized membrane protein YdbT with pleckstrin-like domain